MFFIPLLDEGEYSFPTEKVKAGIEQIMEEK